jgi:hypothetical protein
MAPARRAAWDAYLAVRKFLPVVTDDCGHGPAINAQLGGVVVRIRRYAPLWGEDGSMLTAAVYSAVRIYRRGDRDQLVDLLNAIADRLYLLSIAPGWSASSTNRKR